MENGITFELSTRFIVGTVMVLLAVIIAVPATLSNIRSADSRREKRYLGWTCLSIWVSVLIAITLVVHLRAPYNYVVMAVLMLAFPLGIFRISMHRHVIREQEAEKKQDSDEIASKKGASAEEETK